MWTQVTECITRCNLPACQLMVAMGLPAHRIPDVRRLYGLTSFSDSAIDFGTAFRAKPSGHCIAVRIAAETPTVGFKPTSGLINELSFRSTPNVWGYFSQDSSGNDSEECADSQFGHLFANGTRDQRAAKRDISSRIESTGIV